MKKYRQFFVLLGCALTIAANAGSNDAFVYRLKLEEGANYEFETSQYVETSKIRYRLHCASFLKVVAEEEGAYTLETLNKDLVFAVEGSVDAYLPSSTTTVRQRDDGTILEMKCDTASDAERYVKNPNNFKYPLTPIGVGGHWDNFVPANSELGTPDTTIRYVVSGRKMWRGFDVLVVDFRSDPADKTPMPMHGTTYIDSDSGLSVYTEGYFEDYTKEDWVRSSFRMQIKR
jgi:hypothetical protein